jgi:glutaredoxin
MPSAPVESSGRLNYIPDIDHVPSRAIALTSRRRIPRSIPVACLWLALAGSVHAQFKVVGPDGRVTYTDRPPAAASGAQVLTMRRDGSVAAPSGTVLPLELRQPVARFPVTLYVSSDCAPCDSGRRLLLARGVPFTERTVTDDADTEALVRISDARTVPTLTVGKQVLRGFSETDWQSTLDLAAYPRESRLPRGYVAPAPSPLAGSKTEQAPAALPPAAPSPRPPDAPSVAEPAASGPAIRF